MKFIILFKNGESRLIENGSNGFTAQGGVWTWDEKGGALNEFRPGEEILVSGPYTDQDAYQVLALIKAISAANSEWVSPGDVHDCCEKCQCEIGLREDMHIRQVYRG